MEIQINWRKDLLDVWMNMHPVPCPELRKMLLQTEFNCLIPCSWLSQSLNDCFLTIWLWINPTPNFPVSRLSKQPTPLREFVLGSGHQCHHLMIFTGRLPFIHNYNKRNVLSTKTANTVWRLHVPSRSVSKIAAFLRLAKSKSWWHQ